LSGSFTDECEIKGLARPLKTVPQFIIYLLATRARNSGARGVRLRFLSDGSGSLAALIFQHDKNRLDRS